MKLSKKLIFSLVLIFIFTLILGLTTVNASVEPISADENSIMPISDEDISSEDSSNSKNNLKNLYLSSSSVNVDYAVNGNVFIFANDVTISGSIVGNVFVFGQNVNIEPKAYINSSLFVFADTLTIDGVVFDVFSFANTTNITANARILRDATMGGSSLSLSGAIARNADLAFDTINVTSNTARIGGDVNYLSKSDVLSKDIVGGKINFNQVTEDTKSTNTFSDSLKDLVDFLIISTIIILIIIFATPKFAEKEQKVLENKALASIGYGAIALIAIPIACFILFCTVFGILPALAILLTYIFVIVQMASALVSIPLARIICTKMNKNTQGMNVLISIILVAIIWLLKKVPILGGLISLLVSILALGLLAYSIFHSKIDEKNKDVVAEASTVVEKKEDK